MLGTILKYRTFISYLLRLLCIHISHSINRLFPSSIVEILYVDPHIRSVIPLYSPFFPTLSSWSHSQIHNKYSHTPSNDGAYVFRVWNQETCEYENYILTPKHLFAAFQLKQINEASFSPLFAFSDIGIVTFLSNYINRKSFESILDIIIDGNPALDILQPYIRSINIPENLNAQTLTLWFVYLQSDYPYIMPIVDIFDDKNEKHTFYKNQVLIKDIENIVCE